MKLLCAASILAVSLRAQSERPPDANAQASILARITEHSLHSQDQLPDFICTQLTTRSEDRSGRGNRWKQVDTLEVEFSFIERHPRWKLLKVNEKTTRRSYDQLQNGFLSDAILQFFSLPDSIFGEQARTQFAWNRWDKIDGRRMEVFSLRVLARYSQLAFTNDYGSRVVGFHGLMYADPATQTVMRLELQLDMPADFAARECSLDVRLRRRDHRGTPVSPAGEGNGTPADPREDRQERDRGGALSEVRGQCLGHLWGRREQVES